MSGATLALALATLGQVPAPSPGDSPDSARSPAAVPDPRRDDPALRDALARVTELRSRCMMDLNAYAWPGKKTDQVLDVSNTDRDKRFPRGTPYYVQEQTYRAQAERFTKVFADVDAAVGGAFRARDLEPIQVFGRPTLGADSREVAALRDAWIRLQLRDYDKAAKDAMQQVGAMALRLGTIGGRPGLTDYRQPPAPEPGELDAARKKLADAGRTQAEIDRAVAAYTMSPRELQFYDRQIAMRTALAAALKTRYDAERAAWVASGIGRD
jgi:hypothetical protein